MILQRAWVFSPQSFHEDLVRSTVRNGAVDVEELWRVALGICTDPAPEIFSYLEMLRVDLDEIVITDAPQDADHYVICMAPYMSAVPAPREGGWISQILRRAGVSEMLWKPLDARESLETLIAHFSDPLSEMIRGHLGAQYGGWISGPMAAMLIDRLLTHSRLFEFPPRDYIRELLSHLPLETEESLVRQMQALFGGTIAMLEKAASKDHLALRLIID